MPDPTTITTTQLRAAVTALGLDPDSDITTITLAPRAVTVTRYLRDENGWYVRAPGGAIAEFETSIRVQGKAATNDEETTD